MIQRVVFAFAAVPVLLGLLTGCSGSRIDYLDKQRGAPGETFTIHGSALKDNEDLPFIAPELRRCDKFSLIALDVHEDRIQVRIPPNVPAGVYQVYVYGQPSGAYKRSKTNSVNFWVTAAPVPYSITDKYEVQVKSFRARYSKSPEWESWMLENRGRYDSVFAAAYALPCPVTIGVSYATLPPLPYNPPWSNESEHMTALNRMADPVFPNYHFDFQFGREISSSYAQTIIGGPDSYTSGKVVRLHFETIFNHEFGHVLIVQHHYEGNNPGTGLHFPPGESSCVMDRNNVQYCSACRTALNLPLDVDNYEAIDTASTNILNRYPSGW